MAPQTILVFGGGNALAAYHAGAYEEMVHRDIRPDWIIGASAGAVTGAIIVGNSRERRIERLREFWAEATTATPLGPSDPKLRQYYNGWHVAWAALFGRPSIFRHRWPGFWGVFPGPQNDIALYDHRPLAATLERLVDFDLLNRAEIRFSVAAVDIETGGEVVFDNRKDRIGPHHILASSAITPGFAPVEIDGRMLCDPGYVNNTPVDIAFANPPERETTVILLELFSLGSPRPASIDAVLERTQDILFASPTRKSIEALQREYGLRTEIVPDSPSVRLLHLAYQAPAHELSMKAIDFSPSSIRDRWAAGAMDLRTGFDRLNAAGPRPGLDYVTLSASQPDASAAEASRYSDRP
ncbi:patatin-like phospholipase family protein [Enterovirga rhinocerotis]|uniref:NTE family protein n=1 Tax=Enterovirga rhinocerotis TaxID=1339210 RepID=A0A4R7BJG9_9HYPH|nr:patatin-like phospholipase family protein [Enterovirga rhinocerotis]TDR85311.1 NTE family protein [Enterovirga rhinocerotis]